METTSPQNNQILKVLLQVIGLIFFLYLFLLSINLMGGSLKLFGKGLAETLISTTSNPFVGLFIGILATSLIQSSSSTTSIVVGMVGAGVLSVCKCDTDCNGGKYRHVGNKHDCIDGPLKQEQ